MAFVPPGFDAARIRNGLLTAMSFGAPTRGDDQATFWIIRESVPKGVPLDDEGIPFDPAVARVVTKLPFTVPCAVDYRDGGSRAEDFGSISPTSVTITLLDEEYQQIKDFAYVVCGGDKYFASKVEPPQALGSIDVWTLHCYSADER